MFYKSAFIGLDCVGFDIKGMVVDCSLIALASPDPLPMIPCLLLNMDSIK